MASHVTTTIWFRADSAGLLITPEEFDQAEFDDCWRFELIRGVLVVSPFPSRSERAANAELGYSLRQYGDAHPAGHALDATLYSELLATGSNRRYADRVIWIGLGRVPKRDAPTIVVEFVSSGRRNRRRDYEAKRQEYRDLGCREYWIFDRFQKTLTVVTFAKEGDVERVISSPSTYSTPLLPGFEVPLARLFETADRWARPDDVVFSN